MEDIFRGSFFVGVDISERLPLFYEHRCKLLI